MPMTFSAIDVETANSDRSSICQIGIVQVRDGVIRERWKSLVNPDDRFDPFNISIHGLTSSDVRSSPTWDRIHDDLAKRLNGSIVVSHMPFDRTAVERAAEEHGLPDIKAKWLDSAMIVRRAWPEEFGKRGYGLSNVANHLGIAFRHHDALEDAGAAAQIVLRACKDTGLDVDEWLSSASRRPARRSKPASIAREGNSDGALLGECVVFSGALGIPRRAAAELATEAGCRVVNNVSRKVTLVVLGDQDVNRLTVGETKSSKHRKAEALVQKGAEMQILSESDFQSLVRARW